MLHTVYLTLTLAHRKYTIGSYCVCLFTPRKVGEVSHNAPNPIHPARHTGLDSRGGGPHPSGLGEEMSRGPEAPPLPSRFWPQFHSWFRLIKNSWCPYDFCPQEISDETYSWFRVLSPSLQFPNSV